jgi:hypothetical protein
MVTLLSQLSVALTEPMSGRGTSSMHSTVVFTGQVITGSVLSSIFTTAVQLAVLLQLSLAVQVTVTPVPGAHSDTNELKGGSLLVRLLMPLGSLAVAEASQLL